MVRDHPSSASGNAVPRFGNGEIYALFLSSWENPLEGATVAWLQNGLFNARSDMSPEILVHPGTRARRNRRDSREQPVPMVIGSSMTWLAGD